MATTAQTIIDAAIATSLANDEGRSGLANGTPELLGVLNRKIQQIYTVAGLPPERGGQNTGSFFKAQWTVALGTPATTAVALPGSPAIGNIDTILLSTTVVAIVTAQDVAEGLAELAPGVILENNTIRSPGRTGDPVALDSFTIYGSYLPPLLTAATQYIGATTVTDATTTAWPSHVGDALLINDLALYLAAKDGTRSPDEMQRYLSEAAVAGQILADYLGVNASSLVTPQEVYRNGAS